MVDDLEEQVQLIDEKIDFSNAGIHLLCSVVSQSLVSGGVHSEAAKKLVEFSSQLPPSTIEHQRFFLNSDLPAISLISGRRVSSGSEQPSSPSSPRRTNSEQRPSSPVFRDSGKDEDDLTRTAQQQYGRDRNNERYQRSRDRTRHHSGRSMWREVSQYRDTDRDNADDASQEGHEFDVARQENEESEINFMIHSPRSRRCDEYANQPQVKDTAWPPNRSRRR